MAFEKSGKVEIKGRAGMRRILYSLIVLAVLGPALYCAYGIFRADRIARTDKTIGGFTRAIRYDPSNATLWWQRGRLHHYSVEAANPSLAAEDYIKALSLNPRLGEAWADLADCYDQQGRYAEAEAAFEKAFAVRRFSPLIRWKAGNFYLRRLNLPRMYECFKLACEFDPQKLDIAMDVSWKIDSEQDQILQKLIPDTLDANLRYLQFLMARDAVELAAPVWKRFIKNTIPAGAELRPAAAFSYIDRLLGRKRIPEALRVWDDILRKTQFGLSDARGSAKDPENLVWNGSFENEILRGGFDWRSQEGPSIQFRVDTTNRMEGLKSLHVQFEGENIGASFLYQIVPIFEAGAHQLDLFLRTKDLTTDQTPFVLIQGYPDGAAVSVRSDGFPPSSEWSKISVPFAVDSGCKAIVLALHRNRSSKFDNAIKGELWIDGVVLRRVRG
jgi:hypothetical protein